MLERGEVANSWRRERWDSLRLLTPNWQTRAAGPSLRRARSRRLHGRGRRRGRSSHDSRRCPAAPVRDQHHRHVGERPRTVGYTVTTDSGRDPPAAVSCWRAAPVTSRWCRRSAHGVPAGVAHATPFDYRNPGSLPERRRARGWARRPPACSSRPNSGVRPAGHVVPSASTCGCRARIAAATCCGGWTARACGTSATTRWRISPRARRLPSPQLVGTPRPLHRRSQRAERDGYPAGRPPVRRAAMDGRCSQVGCATNFALAGLKMDACCSTRSTHGPSAPPSRRTCGG